jgi:hypothetical protein
LINLCAAVAVAAAPMLFDGVCSASSLHNSFETTLYGFDFCPGVVWGYFCLDVMTTWFFTPVLSVHWPEFVSDLSCRFLIFCTNLEAKSLFLV